MKNWEPFVSGPLLAIDTTPRAVCCMGAGGVVKHWNIGCVCESCGTILCVGVGGGEIKCRVWLT